MMEDWDEEYCSGHYCPKDCERCHYRADNRDLIDEERERVANLGPSYTFEEWRKLQETVPYDGFTGRCEE